MQRGLVASQPRVSRLPRYGESGGLCVKYVVRAPNPARRQEHQRFALGSRLTGRGRHDPD